MKPLFLLSLIGSCLLTLAEAGPQPAQQQPADEVQQPAAAQLPPEAQRAHMQQPAPQQAPANQPPASPLQNAQSDQQPEAGAPPRESSNVASTLQVYAYPKANQTRDVQSQDESECYQWAQGQGAPPEQQQGPQQSTNESGTGVTVSGSSGSAAVAGDAGEGAAGNAAVEHHKKKKAQQEAEKEQQTQQAPATDNVKRAYSACMESRNYTIK